MNDDPVAAALAGGQIGDDDDPDIYSYKRGQSVDWPFKSTITSVAGESRDGGSRKHTGVDFGGKRGTPVPHAPKRDGIVTEVGSNRKAGNYVRVDDGVWEYTYGHFDKVNVTKDGRVSRGTELGLLGQTGNATGPHVHIKKRPSKLGREGVKARLSAMTGGSSDPVAAALAGTPPASSEPFKSNPARLEGMMEMAGDVATDHQSLGKNRYKTALGTEYTASDGLADQAHAVGFQVPRQQQQRRVVRRVAAPVQSKEARALGAAGATFAKAGAPIANAFGGLVGALAPIVSSVAGPKAQGKVPNVAKRNRSFVTGSMGRAPGEPAADSVNNHLVRAHDPRMLEGTRVDPTNYLAPSHGKSGATGASYRSQFGHRTRASAAPVTVTQRLNREQEQWANRPADVSTRKGLDALAPPTFQELKRRHPDTEWEDQVDPLAIPSGVTTADGTPVPKYKTIQEYYGKNPHKAPPGWEYIPAEHKGLLDALTSNDPVKALSYLAYDIASSHDPIGEMTGRANPVLDEQTRLAIAPAQEEAWRASKLGKFQREASLSLLDALLAPGIPTSGVGRRAFEKSEQLRAYGETPEGKAWLASLGNLENPVRGLINGMGRALGGLTLDNLYNYQESLKANPNAALPGSTEFIGEAAGMAGKAVPQFGALALGGGIAGTLGLSGAGATSAAGAIGLGGSEFISGQHPESPVEETLGERGRRAFNAGALGVAMGPVSAATAPFLDPLVARGERAIAGVAGRQGGPLLNRAGQKVAAVVEKLAIPSRAKSGVDMFGSSYAAALATGQPLPTPQEAALNAGMAVLTGPEWNRFHTAKAIKARAAEVEAGRAPKPPANGDVVELGRAGGDAPVYGQIEHISPNGAVTVRLEDGKTRFLSPKSQETTGLRVLDPQAPEDRAIINQSFALTAEEGPRGGVVPIAADPVAKALEPTLGPEQNDRLEAAKTELESVRQQIREAGGSENAPMDLIDRALDLRLEVEELSGGEPMVPGERTLGRAPDPVATALDATPEKTLGPNVELTAEQKSARAELVKVDKQIAELETRIEATGGGKKSPLHLRKNLERLQIKRETLVAAAGLEPAAHPLGSVTSEQNAETPVATSGPGNRQSIIRRPTNEEWNGWNDDQKRAHNEQVHQALRVDPKTGAGNHVSFREAVEHVRASGREPTVTVADLNALHAIQNALGGHAFGDAIIQAAVDALHEAGLLPHRIGGDEFAIVGTADVATQQAQVDRALEGLRRKQIVGRTKDGRELDVSNLSWSHGTDVAEPGSVIVERGQQAEGAKDVLGGADAKLYEHKTSLEGTDRAPRNPDGSPASRDAIPPSLNVRVRGDAQTRGDRPGLAGDQGQGVAAKKGGASAPPEPPARRKPTFDELDDASSQAPKKGSVKLEIGGQKYTVNAKGEVRDWTGNLVYHPDAGVVDGPHLHTDAKDGSSSIDRPAEESADGPVYPERVEDAADGARFDPLLHVSQPERAPQGLRLNPAAAALFRHLLGDGTGHDITQTYALTLPMDVLPEMINRAEDLLEGGTLSTSGEKMVGEALDILRALDENPDGAITFTLFNIDDVIAEAKKTGDTSHLEQIVAEEIAHGWQFEDVFTQSGRLDGVDWLPPDVAAKMPFRDKIRNFLIDIGYGNKETRKLPDRVLLLEATAQFLAHQDMGLTTRAEAREFAKWLKGAILAEHGSVRANQYENIPVDVERFMRDYTERGEKVELEQPDLSPAFDGETTEKTLGRGRDDDARGTEETQKPGVREAVHEGSGRPDEPTDGSGGRLTGVRSGGRRDLGRNAGEQGKTLGRSRQADEPEPVEGPHTLGKDRTVGKVTDLEPDLVAAEGPRTLGPSSAPDEGPAGLAAVRSPQRRGAAKDTEEHVYFEIAPSKSTKYADAWHAQDNKARAQSSYRIAEATLPKILDAVGLGGRGLTIQHTVGGYQLETNPSTRVSGPISAQKARMLAAAIGYTYRQDSVLVARLDAKNGDTDYVTVTFPKGELTTEQADSLFQHLGKVNTSLGGGYAVKEDTMLLLNVRGPEGPYSELDQDAFEDLVHKAVESYDAPIVLRVAGGESLAAVTIAENDWEAQPNGDGYTRAAAQIGRPETARALDRIRREVDAFHDQIAAGGIREDNEEDSAGASKAVGLAAVRREEQQRFAPKYDEEEDAPGRSRFERTPEFKQFFEKSAVAEEDGTPLVVSHYGHVKDIEVFDRLQPEFRKKGKEDDFDSVGNWFAVNQDAKDFGPEGYHAYLSIQNPKRYTSFRAALADFQAAGGRKPLTFRVGYPAKRALAPILEKVPGVTLEGSSETGVVLAGTRAALVMLDREIEREQRNVAFSDRNHFAKARAAIDKALIARRDGGHPDGVIKDGAKKWRAQLKAEGYDGIIISEETGIDRDRPQTYYVTLEPTQIKQIGNKGTFDKSDPNSLAAVRRPERERRNYGRHLESEGELAAQTALKKLKGGVVDSAKFRDEFLKAGGSKGDFYELGLEDLVRQAGAKVDEYAIDRALLANRVIVTVKDLSTVPSGVDGELLYSYMGEFVELETQYHPLVAQLEEEVKRSGQFGDPTDRDYHVQGVIEDLAANGKESLFWEKYDAARYIVDWQEQMEDLQSRGTGDTGLENWWDTDLEMDAGDAPPRHYEQYSHPGGTDYRELSFQLPEEFWQGTLYEDPHFEQKGAFAHARVKFRTFNGKIYVEVVEIQSDIHQAGRSHGYKTSRFAGQRIQKAAGRMFGAAHAARNELLVIEKTIEQWVQGKAATKSEALVLQQYVQKAKEDWRTLDPGPHVPERLTELRQWKNFERFRQEYLEATTAYKEMVRGSRVDPKRRPTSESVEDIPFKTTWYQYVLKELLQDAIENGAEGLLINTGDEIAKRFGVDKFIKRIAYQSHVSKPLEDVKVHRDYENRYRVTSKSSNGDRVTHSVLTDVEDAEELAEKLRAGTRTWITTFTTLDGSSKQWNASSDDELRRIYGKQIADRMIAGEGHKPARPMTGMGDPTVPMTIDTPEEWVLEGEGLVVRNEGMRQFYDKNIPEFLNKYARRKGWGTKVEKTMVPLYATYADARITETYVANNAYEDVSAWVVLTGSDDTQRSHGLWATKEAAEAEAEKLRAGNPVEMWQFPIPEEMATDITRKGQTYSLAAVRRKVPIKPEELEPAPIRHPYSMAIDLALQRVLAPDTKAISVQSLEKQLLRYGATKADLVATGVTDLVEETKESGAKRVDRAKLEEVVAANLAKWTPVARLTGPARGQRLPIEWEDDEEFDAILEPNQYQQWSTANDNRYYREELLELGALPFYENPHYQTNAFSHNRAQDRVWNGEEWLEVLEIQSDLHQEARTGGGYRERDDSRKAKALYAARKKAMAEYDAFVVKQIELEGLPITDEVVKRVEEGNARLAELRAAADAAVQAEQALYPYDAQPWAPYQKTWWQLHLKRLIQEAIDTGQKGLLINSGETIQRRFNLAHHLTKLEASIAEADIKKSRLRSWDPEDGPRPRQIYKLTTYRPGQTPQTFYVDDFSSGAGLHDYVGEEIAEKVRARLKDAEPGELITLEKKDLEQKESKHGVFYDVMIPRFLEKYAKRLGFKVRVRPVTIQTRRKLDVEVRQLPPHPTLPSTPTWEVSPSEDYFYTLEDAEAYAERIRAGSPELMWAFEIPDGMREQLRETGQVIGLAALRRPLDRGVIGKLNQKGESAEKAVKQRRTTERVSLERLVPQLAKVGAKLLVAPEVTTRAHWKAAMEKRFGKQFSRVHAQVYNEALEIFGAEARAAKVSTSRARGLALRKAAGGALEPNRLELFKKVLDVERTRGDEASLASIASHLEAFIVAMSGRLEPLENPNAPQNAAAREKRVARAAAGMEMELARVVEEIQAQRHTKTSSGLDWYKAAIRRTVRVMTELYPTLADPDHALLFKILLGPTSPNEKPFSNLYKAAKLYEGWLASAKSDDERVFPLRRKNGKRWGFVGLYGALHRLEGLIRMYGFKEALAWLKKKHPLGRPGSTDPNTLRYWKPGLAPADLHGHLEAPGLFIFGPKAGPFASNILGLDYLTVDLWATRTYNSLMGTLVGWDTVDKELEKQLDKAGTWGEENVDWRWHPTEEGRKQRWAPIEQPRNEGERQIIIDAFVRATRAIAARFGVKLKVPDAQALLWFAEQYLYRAHGAKNESWTFDQAALEYVRQHGILANARGIQPRHTAAGSRVSGVAAEVHVPRPRTIRRAEATPAGTAPGSAAEAAEKANSVVVRLPAPGVTGILRLNPPAAALAHQLFGWGPASEIDWTGRVVDIGLLQDMLPRLRTMATSEHLSANARQRAAALLAGMTDIVLAGGKGEKRAAVSVELRNLDGLSKANAEKTLKELELRGIIFEEMYKRHESRKDGSILKETKKARLPHQAEVLERLEDEGYAYTTENAMLLEVIPRVFGNNETFGLEGKALIDLRAALGRILKENIDDATAKRFRRGVTPDLSTLKGAYPRPGRKPIELAPDLSPSEEEEEADQERAARAQRGGALAAVRRAPRPFFYGAAEKAREILSKQKGETVNPDAFLKAAAAKQIPKGDLVELGLAKILVPGGRSIPKDYLEALIAANEMEVEVVRLGKGASTEKIESAMEEREELARLRDAAHAKMTQQVHKITDQRKDARSVVLQRNWATGRITRDFFDFVTDLISRMREVLENEDVGTQFTFESEDAQLVEDLSELQERARQYYGLRTQALNAGHTLARLQEGHASTVTQYSKYAPTDKVDYFELLFRLPVRTLGDFPSAKELMSPEAQQELADMDREHRENGLRWDDALRISVRGAELTKEYRDSDAELSSKLTSQAMYTAPHWAAYAPRAFAHARASIREINGKRYLEAHELQSDLLQAYRKYGIKGQPPPEPEPLTEFPKGDQFVVEPIDWSAPLGKHLDDMGIERSGAQVELNRRTNKHYAIEQDWFEVRKALHDKMGPVSKLPGWRAGMDWQDAFKRAQVRETGWGSEHSGQDYVEPLPPYPAEFIEAVRKLVPGSLSNWTDDDPRFRMLAKVSTRTGHKYISLGVTATSEEEARGPKALKLIDDYLMHLHKVAVQKNATMGAPDVPFKTTWHEFILKRLIQVALDAGLDGIIIDNGATVSHFLSLEREVSKLTWTSKEGATKGRLVALGAQDGSTIFDQELEESQLPEYIGAELTTKLLATKEFADSHTLSGDGLKVEGKGQKEFYDGKLLNFLNKYSRRHQWGAKVEETRLRPGATTNSFHIIKVMQPLTWDDGAQLMHLTGGFYVTDLERMWRKVSSLEAIPTELPKDTVHPFWTELVPKDKGFRATIYRTGEGLEGEVTLDQNGLTRFLRKIAKDALGDTPFDDLRPLDKGWLFEFTDKLKEDILEHGQDVSLAARRRPARAADTEPKAKTRTEVRKVPGQAPIAGAGGEPRRPRKDAELEDDAITGILEEGDYGLAAKRRPKLANDDEMTRVEKAQHEARNPGMLRRFKTWAAEQPERARNAATYTLNMFARTDKLVHQVQERSGLLLPSQNPTVRNALYYGGSAGVVEAMFRDFLDIQKDAIKQGLDHALPRLLNLHAYDRAYKTKREHMATIIEDFAQDAVDQLPTLVFRTLRDNGHLSPQNFAELQRIHAAGAGAPSVRLKLGLWRISRRNWERANIAGAVVGLRPGKTVIWDKRWMKDHRELNHIRRDIKFSRIVPEHITEPMIQLKLNNLYSSLDPDQVTQLNELADRHYALNRSILDTAYDAGIISAKAYATMTKRGDRYVPLSRIMETLEESTPYKPTPDGLDLAVQKILYRLKGSEKYNIDPIIASMARAQETIREASANLAALTFIELRNHDPMLGAIIHVRAEGEKLEPGMGELAVFDNGKVQKWVVPEAVAREMHLATAAQARVMGQAFIGFVNHVFKAGATGANLAFALPNVVRDVRDWIAFAEHAPRLYKPHELAKATGQYLASMYHVLRKDQVYREWLRSGAAYSTRQKFFTPEDFLKTFWGDLVARPWKAPLLPLHAVTHVVSALEETTKVTAFRRAKKGFLKEGFAPDEAQIAAAYESRTYGGSHDFAIGGSYAPQANLVMPFIRARTGGTRRAIRTFSGADLYLPGARGGIGGLSANPNARRPGWAKLLGKPGVTPVRQLQARRVGTALFRLFSKMAVSTILGGLYYQYGIKPYEEDYKKIPPSERDSNWIVFTDEFEELPNGEQKRIGYKIPMSHVDQMFFPAIISMYRWAGGEPDQKFENIVANELLQFSPVGINRGEDEAAPRALFRAVVSNMTPLLRSPFEQGSNWDTFRDMSIESAWMQEVDPSKRFVAGRTSPAYIKTAEYADYLIRRFSNGKQDYLINNPIRLQKLVEDVTGGASKMGTDLIDAAIEDAPLANMDRKAKIPILGALQRRFIVSSTNDILNQQNERFYRNLETAGESIRSFRRDGERLGAAEAARYLEDPINFRAAAFSEELAQIARGQAILREGYNAVAKHETMSIPEKRAAMKELVAEEKRLLERAEEINKIMKGKRPDALVNDETAATFRYNVEVELEKFRILERFRNTSDFKGVSQLEQERLKDRVKGVVDGMRLDPYQERKPAAPEGVVKPGEIRDFAQKQKERVTKFARLQAGQVEVDGQWMSIDRWLAEGAP